MRLRGATNSLSWNHAGGPIRLGSMRSSTPTATYPRAARQTIEATTASAFESDVLGIPEGAPMLLLEGITTTDRGAPIEWFQAIYRADRVKIAVESQGESPSLAMAAPPMSVMLT